MITRTLTALLALGALTAQAQVAGLGDLNPGDASSELFENRTATRLGDGVVFAADDGTNGAELWYSDGTGAGTTLLVDINAGSESSEPANFYLIDDGLAVFTADDGTHGIEWWRTDGTAAGTSLVADINPGAGDGVYANTFADFALIRGVVYYTGLDRDSDFEPWRTDGTAAGTFQLGNLGFDQGSFITGSFPEAYASYNGEIYVGGREGLWKLPVGDTALVEVHPDQGAALSFEPFYMDSLPTGLVVFGNVGFSEANIYVTQGDATSTELLAPVPREVQYTLNNPEPFGIRLGDRLYFPGSTTDVGVELFATDGTAAGTGVFADLNPATDDGYPPQNKLVLNGYLYYKYDDGATGIELWRTDGTAGGTEAVTDIEPGSSFFLPSTVDAVGDYVMFRAGGAFSQRPFAYDTRTGELLDGDSPQFDQNARPSRFVAYGDEERAFFFADAGDDFGREPFTWEPRGEPSGVRSARATSFGVSPNPATTLVELDLPAGDYRVEVLDALGRVVQQADLPHTGRLDVRGLPGGTYYILAHGRDDARVLRAPLVRQ